MSTALRKMIETLELICVWCRYIADYTQRILVTSVDKSLKIIDYESGEARSSALHFPLYLSELINK